MKKRIFIFALLAILVSSCGVSTSSLTRPDHFILNRATSISDYQIIQTLDADFGLAMNPYNGMVIALKSSSQFYPIYDKKVIKGTFVMIDTYSYETVKNEIGNSKIKTVPLVIPYKEFKNK